MFKEKDTVKIKNKYIYDSFKELYGHEYMIEEIENNLLKFIEENNEKNKVESNEITQGDFDKFNNIVYSSVGKDLSIDLCIGKGTDRKTYKLLGYKLSYPKKSLEMSLERKEDVYSFAIYSISNIEINKYDDRGHVWLYDNKNMVRKIIFNYGCFEIDTDGLCYEKTIKINEYEKYEDTDFIAYQLGMVRNSYPNCVTEDKRITDKCGKNVCLLHVMEDDCNGTIYLIQDKRTRTLSDIDKLFYTINRNFGYIEIDDIQNNNSINIGIGSAAIDMLYDFAKINKIKYIKGFLSNQDIDHRDRQVHFYKKKGFDVNLENMQIRLNIIIDKK